MRCVALLSVLALGIDGATVKVAWAGDIRLAQFTPDVTGAPSDSEGFSTRMFTPFTPSIKAPSAPRIEIQRPDPVDYSVQVWPEDTLPYRKRVSKMTKYGLLSCIGGSGSQIPRKCSWD